MVLDTGWVGRRVLRARIPGALLLALVVAVLIGCGPSEEEQEREFLHSVLADFKMVTETIGNDGRMIDDYAEANRQYDVLHGLFEKWRSADAPTDRTRELLRLWLTLMEQGSLVLAAQVAGDTASAEQTLQNLVRAGTAGALIETVYELGQDLGVDVTVYMD